MIVEGQVHGGLAQGIGQALLEDCVYDNESGQLLTGSLHGLRDAARRRRAVVQGRHEGHAVHAQSARREGLRRGGRDRRAGGGDERRARRAGAAGRQALRHARVAASRVAGAPSGQGRLTRTGRNEPCTQSNYQQPKSVADAAALLAKTGGKAFAGGQSLVAAMKLRLAQPGTVVDLAGIRRAHGHARPTAARS